MHVKITKTQVEALCKIATAAGHGIGEFSYISRATARVLVRHKLIKIASRSMSGGRTLLWAVATEEGVACLGQSRFPGALNTVEYGRTPDREAILMLGIHVWEEKYQTEDRILNRFEGCRRGSHDRLPHPPHPPRLLHRNVPWQLWLPGVCQRYGGSPDDG